MLLLTPGNLISNMATNVAKVSIKTPEYSMLSFMETLRFPIKTSNQQ